MSESISFESIKKTKSIKLMMVQLISILTSVVAKHDIYFNVQAQRPSVHVNGYCGTGLNFDTDCCIGHSTKF